MGIFSRSSNKQETTTNEYDQRVINDSSGSEYDNSVNVDLKNDINTDNRVTDSNNSDSRSYLEQSTETTSSGDFSGVAGTVNYSTDSPEAWAFGEAAFNTIKETTSDGYDAFTNALVNINESNQAGLYNVAGSIASNGASNLSDSQNSMSKNILYAAVALGLLMVFK